LTETQYEQVLNNLAMFCLDLNAVPSQVALKSGSTQIGDTGSLGFLGVAGINTKFGSSPTVAATRSIVDQWGTVPLTDDNTLKILRKAYKTALGHTSFLTEFEANDMGHDMSQLIGTNADISTDIDTRRTLLSLYTKPIGRRDRGTDSVQDAVQRAVESQDAVQRAVGAEVKLDKIIRDTLDECFLEYEKKTEEVDDCDNPALKGFKCWTFRIKKPEISSYDLRLYRDESLENIPKAGRNLIIVALVKDAKARKNVLHFRIFGPDGKVVEETDETRLTGLTGPDLRLMSWGDGAGVPTSGNNLVIIGTDNNGLLHIRIFDASGCRVTDTDETKLPTTQAGAILALKQQIPGLLLPHMLTSAEKSLVISEVTSIVDQTRLTGKVKEIKDLKDKLENCRLWPPRLPTGPQTEGLIADVKGIVGPLPLPNEVEVSTGLTKETRRRINEIQEELIKTALLGPGWFHVGCKKDVPKNACYVGYYKSCGQECFVWVCPEGRAALADFTISILKLSSAFKETQILTVPSGIQFSPALTRPIP
jgi:hypothetical protein